MSDANEGVIVMDRSRKKNIMSHLNPENHNQFGPRLEATPADLIARIRKDGCIPGWRLHAAETSGDQDAHALRFYAKLKLRQDDGKRW